MAGNDGSIMWSFMKPATTHVFESRELNKKKEIKTKVAEMTMSMSIYDG